VNLNNNLITCKKLLLIFILIQILAGVAGTRVFAQNCDHWLKIVQIDKSVGDMFIILDDDGTEIKTIIIPTGTDAVAAGRIIQFEHGAHKNITCFKRVGPYLYVNNIHNYKILDIGSPVGYKLVEVNRPDFVSKADSAIATADPKTRWITEVLKINSDTEMYDGYTIDPIKYGPQEPPFGNPSERKTSWWEYKVRLYKNIFNIPTAVEVRCATSDGNTDHFITVKLKVKKLVLKE